MLSMCVRASGNPTCFGHYCLPIFRGPSFVLSAATTSLLVCIVKLFIWYVAVCCLCVCVPQATLHVSVTTVCPSSGGRLSCLVPLLLLFLFASSSYLFGMWLYVVYVCACLRQPYMFRSLLFAHLQGAVFRA